MMKRKFYVAAACGLLAFAVAAPGVLTPTAEAGRTEDFVVQRDGSRRPSEKDVRGGAHGGPKAANNVSLNAQQSKTLAALRASAGGPLVVGLNGLTGTPRAIYKRDGYLTAPSAGDPDAVARDFIGRWRDVFRFTDADLKNLKVKSRSFLPDLGTTVIVYSQQQDGLSYFKGEVQVNVNREGRLMFVGGESYPAMKVTNAKAIAPEAAIAAAARDMGLHGWVAQPLGRAKVLANYGEVEPEYIKGERFGGGRVFADDIVVTHTIFPMGTTGRHAYKFQLTTPQYQGIVWENIVDAQTGEVLRRTSLTMFQHKTGKKGEAQRGSGGGGVRKPAQPGLDFGAPGGGPIDSRRGSFRPDLQDYVEGSNAAGSAQAKVFDVAPTALSGRRECVLTPPAVPPAPCNANTGTFKGYGRPTTRGERPGYRADVAKPATIPRNNGRGFMEGMVRARTENPFSITGGALFSAIYDTPFGQLVRGMPDALNPSAGSPYGWYYLPTGSNGAEITAEEPGHTTTKNYGYTMAAEAKRRNTPENSPVPCTGTVPTRDCDQPFSATLTTLPAPVTLPDGRTLTQVFQSNYTEGNNVLSADDRANDQETTTGIRGYDPNRLFTGARFDFINGYEFGGVDAICNNPSGVGPCTPVINVAGRVTFPASSDPDVFPATLSLFYFNNIVHDYLYEIGFTEPLFNFQQDNFGRGGMGRDGIIAQVHDGSGTDNANMSPQPEGTHPRMQMYLFTEAGFRRADGSFDFDVIAHEQMHAINNRAVGKGDTGCVGNGLVGESGGQGEGWGDYIADSMGDDDAIGEFVTGEFDVAIRRLPVTNYRWSYQSINGNGLTRRDRSYNPAALPDPDPGAIPFETHDGGELWSATLWDMRELLIMKDANGVFFDGTRRLDAVQGVGGLGAEFFIGSRKVRSVDAHHPIEYRNITTNPLFDTTTDSATGLVDGVTPNIVPERHIVRPGLIAAEIQTSGNRNGPLSTATRNGARLADTLMLRGMQLSPCNPTFVDSRDSILAADREMNGGENRAIIWRAFASHGVGLDATSSSNGGAGGTVVEDFNVPVGVTACEQQGPLPAPAFALANTLPNTVTVTITPVAGAARFIISRADEAGGPFVTVADVAADAVNPTVYNDNNGGAGLILNEDYYYQVRASRDAGMDCVSTANTQSITVTVGVPVKPAPIFNGVNEVLDPKSCTALVVGWGPAITTNPTAAIVYDVYRSEVATDPGPRVGNPTGSPSAPLEPTFEPTAQNKIATVSGLSYTDNGRELNRVYYYIVQARDTDANKIDTDNVGNRKAKFNAPSSPTVTNAPTFAFEDFEEGEAGQDDSNTRFTPPLVDPVPPNDPKGEIAAFQRVTGVVVPIGSEDSATSSMMFAPDYNPGDSAENCGGEGGGASDFSTTIGPFTLTKTSVMEFDHFFNTEAGFDGGVLEIKVGGDATFNSTPYPDEVTTFDLGNYIVQGGYNARLNGTLEGAAIGSPLQGRRAYTGAQALLRHVRIPLEAFAPGGVHNPQGLPVRIRFRMTSDVLSVPSCDAGWFIDNLVINNLDPASCPQFTPVNLGDVIISEFRLRGPGGAEDEFIELYNRTNAPVVVAANDGSGGFSIVAGASQTVVATIPSGTVIPARGHLLVANSDGYSLKDYGGVDEATADITYSTDIPDNTGVSLFRTTIASNFTPAGRLDSVGFETAQGAGFKEGTGIAPVVNENDQQSFVRSLTTGRPIDTDNNAADFLTLSTTGCIGAFSGTDCTGSPAMLGAPGPQNSRSPLQRNATIKASLIDPAKSSTESPNRLRNTTPDPNPANNSAAGTFTIRRKFTNNTGQAVTRLRFRLVDVTTYPAAGANADLRARTSVQETVTISASNCPTPPCNVTVRGLTLEEPPAQPEGGGYNATLRAGTITTAVPLAPGASINVQFLLGVEKAGNFRFLINVEALP